MTDNLYTNNNKQFIWVFQGSDETRLHWGCFDKDGTRVYKASVPISKSIIK